jgi:arylsulfatase A-like enzyme
MFTGLYPWEHGVHSLGSVRLPPELPTIAGCLRQAGYASLSVSSNFLINSDYGLVRDFDKAYWGGWWEPYFRLPPEWRLNGKFLNRGDQIRGILRRRGNVKSWMGQLPPMLKHNMVFFLRHTYLLDVFQRFLVKLNNIQALDVTSSWIEPTLQTWIGSQPKEVPVFCFINLLDAHEPYFSSPEVIHGFGDWLSYARLRQDRQGWIEGKWRASPRELKILHDLYRHSLNVIDGRLKRIIEVFKEAGRWDDTLFILTGDHGQAFGEHGSIFHISGICDEQVRVPLWVRYPSGDLGGTESQKWVSLVDVKPTVLDVAGVDGISKGSGSSLRSVDKIDRAGPVLTVSDGHGYVKELSITATRAKALFVAAYKGKWKVIVDVQSDNPPRAFDIAADPKEEKNLWDKDDPELLQLAEEATKAGLAVHEGRSKPPSAEVVERLRTWGYV